MSYNRDDVVTPEQVRAALDIGETPWKDKRHIFPWSYALGPKSARIRWGLVLDTLERATSDDLAKKRRRSA